MRFIFGRRLGSSIARKFFSGDSSVPKSFIKLRSVLPKTDTFSTLLSRSLSSDGSPPSSNLKQPLEQSSIGNNGSQQVQQIDTSDSSIRPFWNQVKIPIILLSGLYGIYFSWAFYTSEYNWLKTRLKIELHHRQLWYWLLFGDQINDQIAAQKNAQFQSGLSPELTYNTSIFFIQLDLDKTNGVRRSDIIQLLKECEIDDPESIVVVKKFIEEGKGRTLDAKRLSGCQLQEVIELFECLVLLSQEKTDSSFETKLLELLKRHTKAATKTIIPTFNPMISSSSNSNTTSNETEGVSVSDDEFLMFERDRLRRMRDGFIELQSRKNLNPQQSQRMLQIEEELERVENDLSKITKKGVIMKLRDSLKRIIDRAGFIKLVSLMKEWKWTIIALCCFGMLQSTISWILVIFDYETQRREAVLKQLLSSSPFLNNELIVFRRDTILQQQPTHIKSSPWNIVFPQTEKSLTLAFFRILFVLIAGIATDNIGYYIVLLICGMSSAISGLLWSFSDSLDTHELVWINSYRLFMQILSSIGSSSDVPTYLALSKCFLQSDYPTFIVACWLASRLTGIFIARAITTIHRRSNWPISKLLSNTNISNLPWRAFLIDTTSIHDSALLVIVVIISSTFIFFLSCCLYSKSSSSNSLYSINPQSLYYTECTQQTNFHVVDLSQQNQKTFVKIPYQSNQIKDLFKHPKFVGLPSDSILHSQFSWKIWLQHLLTKRNILIICFTISLSIAIQASHSDVFLRRLFGVTKHSKVQVTGGVVPSAQLWPYVGYVVSLIPLRISLNAFPLVSPTLQILLVTIISTPLIGLLADIALRWEFLAGIGLIMLVIGRSILRSSWSTLGHVILGIGLSSNWGCRGSALATNCLRGTEATSYAVLKCADFIGVATASYFISYFSTVTQLTTVTGIQFPPSGPFLAFAIFVVVSGILLFILSRQSSRRRSIVSSLHFPKRIDLENHDPDGNLDQHQIHLEIIDDQQSRRMLIEH